MSQSKYTPDDLGESKVTNEQRLAVPVAGVRALGATKGDKIRWHEEEDRIVGELVGDE